MSLTWTEYKHGYRQLDSYWQRGFDHGYAGRHEELPSTDGEFSPINRGYMNGYKAGWQRLAREAMFAEGAA